MGGGAGESPLPPRRVYRRGDRNGGTSRENDMNKQLDLIYRHTPDEYRSVIDGKKCILILRPGEGTCLVSLTNLTPDELAHKLTDAVKAEARQLGRQAHAEGIGAAPSLDRRCMALVADMNPSGEIGAGYTSIIFEAWSCGWHEANTADAAAESPSVSNQGPPRGNCDGGCS
jgi:hypothetical protein